MQYAIQLVGDVIGPRGFIVDDATEADVAQWRAADPDTVLTFPSARIHLVADPSRASCRAGDIVAIRRISE